MKEHFKQAFEFVQTQVFELGGFEINKEVTHVRRRNFYWMLMNGFNNSEGAKYNPALRKIAIMYAKIRLGLIRQKSGTEMNAMIKAITYHGLEVARRSGAWRATVVVDV